VCDVYIFTLSGNTTATFSAYVCEGTACTLTYQFKLTVDEDDSGQCIQLQIAHNTEDLHGKTPGDHVAGISPPNHTTVPSEEWLKDVLLPKIVKWSLEAAASSSTSHNRPKNGLIPLDRFATTYSRMKDKYGRELVQNWSESTDPRKYVYEDIAISAYLITLWEEERVNLGLEKKQSFVDLGCGNGLLVYLLTCEGYPGKGIDLQKRKIWKLFQPQTVLEERSIVPSDANLFPETDWLIGNHSDELTPWIPLIAARSSYNAKFFVLPCCPHDFIGRYSRPSPHKSQYRCYLDYVAHISRVVGFRVEEDTMRIPSNKRICFIGRERSYLPHEEAELEGKRRVFLEERCKGRTPSLTTDHTHVDDMPEGHSLSENWCSQFHPRPQESLRKNCTQVDAKLSQYIVTVVAEAILKSPLRKDGSVETTSEDSSTPWSVGEGLPLDQVASLFDHTTLQHLKQEYGGLQTLLKNHHQVFEILSGHVCIRDWSVNDFPQKKKKKLMPKKSSKIFYKTKMCWFALHHPQGCPRTADACPYAHSKLELNSRPSFDQ
jgi:tRNASer (uridine44-2'-O)-methyltransferase